MSLWKPGAVEPALEVIESGIALDLVLLDFAMPGMNGAELARQVQRRRLGLPFMFVTGFAHQPALAGVSDAFIVRKPFVDDELDSKIRSILSRPPSENVVRLREA
jgi:CheY-like chemotaxis protein